VRVVDDPTRNQPEWLAAEAVRLQREAGGDDGSRQGA